MKYDFSAHNIFHTILLLEETETRITTFNEAFTIAKHNFIKTMTSQANVILSRIKQKEMLFL